MFYLSFLYAVGLDHVRVHPKFLHSNATSHKWALGAFAELLDNSLDEVCYGATFVNVDVLENKKDGSRMLLIEDDGGGMDPDKMRQCMSLGYSAKSKLANVIGQYGNGFKTSTMRLGADVIVFSRSRGRDGKSPTQSIGMLSYTFLRSTAKEDIVVPMLDYEKVGRGWNRVMRSSSGDWDINVETIVQWSPYLCEADLLHQFSMMKDHGTRIIIYNLWEDDQGELELDFCEDRNDIQIRGVNRDERKIQMAKQFPNSRHFLTYRHSLRSYASILYLRLPPGFRIVLRGKDVEHHNIVNDLMITQEITYRPQPGADGVQKEPNMVAVVTVGFVKDAKDHIDVQGFNVYHKNRLIKPFWRVWNAAGSDGRGVIGVLEANFVEPAHDKQGFERTTVLSRLESRLVQMQKTYWSSNCQKIGYAPRRQKKLVNEAAARESSPEYSPYQSHRHSNKSTSAHMNKNSTLKDSVVSPKMKDLQHVSRQANGNGGNKMLTSTKYGIKSSSSEPTSSFAEEDGDSVMQTIRSKGTPNGGIRKASPARKSLQKELSKNTSSFSPNSDNSEVRLDHVSNGVTGRVLTRSQIKETSAASNEYTPPTADTLGLNQLKVDNRELKDRLKKMEESFSHDLKFERDKNRSLEALVNGDSDLDASGRSQLKMENHKLKNSLKKMEETFLHDLQYERDRCKSLEAQLKDFENKIEEMNKEQEALIDIFSEERKRRDDDEENLRRKLKDASNTIQQLLDKVKQLETLNSQKCKIEH
ncbi:hypothetical protein IFM89_031149 [Coptis chinensis]|uniref:Morc S5 domain-containing protein n=1 Tax=Coptis chinensis TaxID=261450 RepID=A0A835MFY8_9MAGN|nr:hypothetical protein IFM89_031149 [Coptis chinensis]